MGIINEIVNQNINNKPLKGLRLGLSLHVTKETSVLVIAMTKLGSKIALCSANPLSVQEDIAAFLSSEGVNVFAWKDETEKEYLDNLRQVLEYHPRYLQMMAQTFTLWHTRRKPGDIGWNRGNYIRNYKTKSTGITGNYDIQ